MDRIQSSLPLDEEMKLVKRFPADTCMLHVFKDPSRRLFAAYIGTHRVHTRSISRWFSTMEEALVQTFRIYTYRLYILDRPQLWMEDYTDVILTMDMLFQIISLPLLS